jgi:hypothetical protein
MAQFSEESTVPIIIVRFFKKLGSSSQIFNNYSDTKFNDNLSNGSLFLSCGLTCDDASSSFLQFFECSEQWALASVIT